MKAQNFTELFDEVATQPEADKDEFVRQANHISEDRMFTWVGMLSLISLILATFCGIQQMRIEKRNHIIRDYQMLLAIPSENSAKFECVHCGWQNELRCHPDTINSKKR